jgi:myo-inositol 2-dehydrogenase/D-chiro-inositol 1-dehydrogenase
MAGNSVRWRARCRIGFVGTGAVATRHAGILASFDDAEIVAVTDLDHDRAAAFAQARGGRAVPDVAALIDAGVDAAYVCVPPFAHGAAEPALAAAGIALFVEKPLALDVPTAQQISDRIAAAGVVSRVGHHWRCAEPVRRARDLLAGRTVRQVSGYWLDKVPPVPWWTDRARSGVALVEQAVHILDLARALVGEVDEVYALSAGPPEGGTTDVATSGVLRFAGGAVGTVSTTCALAGKLRAGLEIVADGLVVGVGEDWLHVGDGISTRRRRFDPGTARRAADREFLDAVRGDGSPPAPLGLPDHAEALRSHRLACALATSVGTRVPEAAR